MYVLKIDQKLKLYGVTSLLDEKRVQTETNRLKNILNLSICNIPRNVQFAMWLVWYVSTSTRSRPFHWQVRFVCLMDILFQLRLTESLLQ